MSFHLERARRLEGFAQQDPSNPELIRDIAASYAAAGEHRSALTWYERLRALAGESGSVLSAIGFARMALGEWNQAAEAFAAAVELEPGVAALWFNRGYAELAAGEAEQARQSLQKALELGGDEVMFRYQLARACENAGDDKAARHHLEEVIRRQPDHADARSMLALLDLFEGRIDHARREVGQILQQNPAHRDALLMRAQLALLDMDAEAALRFLVQAERSRPGDDGEVLVLRGQALLMLQRFAQAKRAFARGAEVDAASLPACLGLIWVALGQDQLVEAETWLRRAQALDSDDADVIGAESMLLFAQRKAEAAADAADRALAVDEANIPALLVKTALAAEQDDRPQAAALCRKMFAGAEQALGADFTELAKRAAQSPTGSRVIKKYLRRNRRP